MNIESRLPLALLFLRIGVFVVMLMWTIDKFVRPEHASAVYAHFYQITGLGNNIFYIIGTLELLILLGFLFGYQKRITYGVVFVLHAISTLSSYQQYLSPYTEVNLLFFAAFPMLAASFAPYYLRDADTLLVIEKQ